MQPSIIVFHGEFVGWHGQLARAVCPGTPATVPVAPNPSSSFFGTADELGAAGGRTQSRFIGIVLSFFRAFVMVFFFVTKARKDENTKEVVDASFSRIRRLFCIFIRLQSELLRGAAARRDARIGQTDRPVGRCTKETARAGSQRGPSCASTP